MHLWLDLWPQRLSRSEGTRVDMQCEVCEALCCVQDESLVVSLIQRHLKYTKSAVARAILNDWQTAKQSFVKVFPHEYARALAEKGTTEARCFASLHGSRTRPSLCSSSCKQVPATTEDTCGGMIL